MCNLGGGCSPSPGLGAELTKRMPSRGPQRPLPSESPAPSWGIEGSSSPGASLGHGPTPTPSPVGLVGWAATRPRPPPRPKLRAASKALRGPKATRSRRARRPLWHRRGLFLLCPWGDQSANNPLGICSGGGSKYPSTYRLFGPGGLNRRGVLLWHRRGLFLLCPWGDRSANNPSGICSGGGSKCPSTYRLFFSVRGGLQRGPPPYISLLGRFRRRNSL